MKMHNFEYNYTFMFLEKYIFPTVIKINASGIVKEKVLNEYYLPNLKF